MSPVLIVNMRVNERGKILLIITVKEYAHERKLIKDGTCSRYKKVRFFLSVDNAIYLEKNNNVTSFQRREN